MESTETNVSSFEELPQKGSGKRLDVGQAARLTRSTYEHGIDIFAGAGNYLQPWEQVFIEITDKAGESLPSKDHLEIVVNPTPAGEETAYIVQNPHLQKEMTIWVYGQEKKLKPGEEFKVPSKKPDQYKDIEGIEDGAFYAMIGVNQAVKVSRKALSNDVSIKAFSIDKKSSDHEESQKEEQEEEKPEEDNSELNVSWKVGGPPGGGLWQTLNFGSGENDQVKVTDSEVLPQHAQIKIDTSKPNTPPQTTLTISRGAQVWVKSESQEVGKYVTGEVALSPNTYFRIGEKVYYYVGGLKVIEVKKKSS